MGSSSSSKIASDVASSRAHFPSKFCAWKVRKVCCKCAVPAVQSDTRRMHLKQGAKGTYASCVTVKDNNLSSPLQPLSHRKCIRIVLRHAPPALTGQQCMDCRHAGQPWTCAFHTCWLAGSRACIASSTRGGRSASRTGRTLIVALAPARSSSATFGASFSLAAIISSKSTGARPSAMQWKC